MTQALTDFETAALGAIVGHGLKQMGGKETLDLLDDNFSWFDANDLARALNVKIERASGVMASLEAKGMIDADGKDWALTEDGIVTAGEINAY